MGSTTRVGEKWYEPCIEEASRYLELDHSSIASVREMARVRIISTRSGMPWSTMLNLVYNTLVAKGCHPRIVKNESGVFLLLKRAGQARARVHLWLVLAVLTVASVYFSGVALSRSYPGSGLAATPWGYALGLLVPLLAHEAGHWLMLRRYRTPASPPYLLPAPPIQAGFLGTFGAVINMRWLPPSDRALALSAIAGPLAGFIVGLPFAVLGVRSSIVVPSSGAGGVIPLVPMLFALLPPPRSVGPHEVLVLSPMGFAAYIVFFVTFLNLIPVSTLDGGHIVRVLLGYKGHKLVSNLTVLLLIAASIRWPMLALFAAIALFFHLRTIDGHPGSAMGVSRPRDPVIGAVAVIYSVLLLLTLPVPVG